MADNKQAALIDAISKGVTAAQAPTLEKVLSQLAQIQVSVNAATARIAVLEDALGSGAGAAKRQVRAAGGAKKPAGKPAGGAKKPAGDPSKVSNALLFFRYAMGPGNLEGFRDTYATDENVADAKENATVAKQNEAKDPDAFYSAVAHYLWTSKLADDEKEQIRSQFGQWKDESAREAADPPLEEEEADA
jgi:hypothetical protein